MFGKQAFTPLPENMELSVSISVKPLSSTLPDNMNNTVNFANRICPFHTFCYYCFIYFRQLSKRVNRAYSIN